MEIFSLIIFTSLLLISAAEKNCPIKNDRDHPGFVELGSFSKFLTQF